MGEKDKQGEKYPFEVKFDERIDWDSLSIRLQFSGSPSEEDKRRLQELMGEWADKGVEEGYGKDGVMHYLADEIEWNDEGHWGDFFVDMGSDDGLTALDELFSKLSSSGLGIKGIKLGSGYSDW